MIHLRMTGQVLIAEAGAARPAHTHVVMHLDPLGDHARHELWFVDPRTFGEVVVFDPDQRRRRAARARQARRRPDRRRALAADAAPTAAARHRLLKPMLLDQHVIAGIGNIYADEILHEARLRPDRMSDELGPPPRRGCTPRSTACSAPPIAAGGSTLGDNQYVDLYGDWGSYQEAHKVYGRTGERCLTCGVGWIRRIDRPSVPPITARDASGERLLDGTNRSPR